MKNCIQCNLLIEDNKKFCEDCGTKQPEIKSNYNNDGKYNATIGDKNIISGNIIGKNEEIKVAGNATFNKIEDDTKKIIICTFSGKHLLRGRDLVVNCPNCKSDVSQEYFNTMASRCFNCDKQAYSKFSKQLDVILQDGIIDPSERIQLDSFANSLLIDELTKQKLEVDARERNINLNTNGLKSNELIGYYKIKFKKAVVLLFENRDLVSAINILSSIHQENILHDETASLFFLAKAIQTPTGYVNDYENKNERNVDLYWEHFWVFISYFKLDRHDQGFKIINQNKSRFLENKNDILLSEVISYLFLFISNNEMEYLIEAKSVYSKLEENIKQPLYVVFQLIKKMLNYNTLEWDNLFKDFNEYEKFYLEFVFGYRTVNEKFIQSENAIPLSTNKKIDSIEFLQADIVDKKNTQSSEIIPDAELDVKSKNYKSIEVEWAVNNLNTNCFSTNNTSDANLVDISNDLGNSLKNLFKSIIDSKRNFNIDNVQNNLRRIEQIRNKIRNIKDTDDFVFNQKIQIFKQNPIILTDFSHIIDFSSKDQFNMNLVDYFNEIFNSVFSGSFNHNIEPFDLAKLQKDANNRKKFKIHLILFLKDANGLFQYMVSKKIKSESKIKYPKQNNQKQISKLNVFSNPEKKVQSKILEFSETTQKQNNDINFVLSEIKEKYSSLKFWDTIKTANKYITSFPNNPVIHFYLGSSYQYLKMYKEALLNLEITKEFSSQNQVLLRTAENLIKHLPNMIDNQIHELNVRYHTIGKQIWSTNLFTKYFKNGDLINYAETDDEWHEAAKNQLPAWCYVDKKHWCYGDKIYETNRDHMVLYNYFAIIDPRGLAPDGWRIAKTKDWNALINSQQSLFNKKVASKLKSKSSWLNPNENMHGTNHAVFDAYPAGYRNSNGEFKAFGKEAQFWLNGSDLHSNTIMIWGDSIGISDNADMPVSYPFVKFEKGCGLSIRLIKI
ncbi:FISUMP domain-containing protein [Flavobacterium chungnamense]|uniref:Fibrobacter succinogenes major paralogous domain-containing protein n=1 Tax=Flavobacterium chungnamense TaxID=706182 RepID=A0ABP7UUI7_9FLAO